MPPHGYIHVLSLTENITEFEKAVHRQKISGNIDTPEGGFDAMLQAAVCEVRHFPLLSVCLNAKFFKNLGFYFSLWFMEWNQSIEEYLLLPLICHKCYSFWYVFRTEGRGLYIGKDTLGKSFPKWLLCSLTTIQGKTSKSLLSYSRHTGCSALRSPGLFFRWENTRNL